MAGDRYVDHAAEFDRGDLCWHCDREATRLCDFMWRVGYTLHQCSKPRCEAHATQKGVRFFSGRDDDGEPAGFADTLDCCPAHAGYESIGVW